MNKRLQHGPGSAWPPWMPNLDQSRGMFHRAIDTLYPPRWFDILAGALPDHFVAGDLVVDTSSRVPHQKAADVVSNRPNQTSTLPYPSL